VDGMFSEIGILACAVLNDSILDDTGKNVL